MDTVAIEIYADTNMYMNYVLTSNVKSEAAINVIRKFAYIVKNFNAVNLVRGVFSAMM